MIGEGEEVILDILETCAAFETGLAKVDKLKRLSKISGLYIPVFYDPVYNDDGTFSKLEKIDPGAPDQILERIVGKLPPPPKKPIVPYIDTVHNRAPLEIMRGCTRGCRFCHAGIVNRPVRERPVDEIIETMETLIPNTGYSEISLLSLSSSDYTQIIPLIETINKRF